MPRNPFYLQGFGLPIGVQPDGLPVPTRGFLVETMQNISRAKKTVAAALDTSGGTETLDMEAASIPRPGKAGGRRPGISRQTPHCLWIQRYTGDLDADLITPQRAFAKNGYVPPFICDISPLLPCDTH